MLEIEQLITPSKKSGDTSSTTSEHFSTTKKIDAADRSDQDSIIQASDHPLSVYFRNPSADHNDSKNTLDSGRNADPEEVSGVLSKSTDPALEQKLNMAEVPHHRN